MSFKVCDGQYLDITTDDFKKLYSGELHWLPKIWDMSGTVQPFVLSSSLLYNYRKFTIYVNAKDGFLSNFETLETSWKSGANDITKMAVDKEDPYFASLLAAYIISHVGEISRKHLTGDNNVITSMARYYVYYHMKRLTENPQKMSSYITTLTNLSKKIFRQKKFGLKNLNVRLPILTIGTLTTQTNTIFGIISTE